MSSSPAKHVRRVAPLELKKLVELKKLTDATFEKVQDAQLAHAELKAAYDTASTRYLREGGRLVAKYRVKEDEEIVHATGEIRKQPKKAEPARPAVPPARR